MSDLDRAREAYDRSVLGAAKYVRKDIADDLIAAKERECEELRGKLAARCEECDQERCEVCHDTGHPWIDGCDAEHSGYDYRVWCVCAVGQMKRAETAEAALDAKIAKALGERAQCPHRVLLWDGDPEHPRTCEDCGAVVLVPDPEAAP